MHNLLPASEFAQWGIKWGIFKDQNGKVVRGPNWGNPRVFCEDDEEWKRLLYVYIYSFDLVLFSSPLKCYGGLNLLAHALQIV